MSEKINRIGKYLIYLLWSNIAYGLMVYFVFTWLSGYSLLYGYVGNLALITIGLIWDSRIYKFLRSNKMAALIMKEKNPEQSYRFFIGLTESFISFKTALYLFYIFILIFSQVLTFDPSLANEKITDFIKANNYSILVLLALDYLIIQFSTDREKMNEVSEKLKQSLGKTEEDK